MQGVAFRGGGIRLASSEPARCPRGIWVGVCAPLAPAWSRARATPVSSALDADGGPRFRQSPRVFSPSPPPEQAYTVAYGVGRARGSRPPRPRPRPCRLGGAGRSRRPDHSCAECDWELEIEGTTKGDLRRLMSKATRRCHGGGNCRRRPKIATACIKRIGVAAVQNLQRIGSAPVRLIVAGCPGSTLGFRDSRTLGPRSPRTSYSPSSLWRIPVEKRGEVSPSLDLIRVPAATD